MTPTELTLKHLRAEGWTVAVVEKWNPHARIRQDLYGFIDILALKGSETLAVQATSYTNMSARIKKIAEIETVAAVREAGWTIWVIGWRKVNNRWTHKIVDVS